MYQEVARWTCLGKGEVEQMIAQQIDDRKTMPIAGGTIAHWVRQKNEQTPNKLIAFAPQPKETYLVYYAYHPSSGYKTDFTKEGEPIVHRTSNGHLPAFFSEVVILQQTGTLVPFPNPQKN